LIVVTDVERRWIMAEATWALAVAALAESALVGRVAFGDALAGGALGLAILTALVVGGVAFAALARVATGRRVGRTVMGGGDVRLAGTGGLILGPGGIGPALLVAILAGGIGAAAFVVLKLIRKGRYRRFSAIPYGPYLVLGIALTLYAPAFTFGLLLGIIRIIRGG
jgi:prepilin signal peptidase PulO-like enzyme (type II secretory pathway)